MPRPDRRPIEAGRPARETEAPESTGPSTLGWSRRDVLRASPALVTVLGASAGLTAGGCRPGPPPVDALGAIDVSGIRGEIVGASAGLGHRLRGGDPLLGQPPTEVHDVPVVIAGGGIAGLSAGWKLARSGYDDFVLLELESTPGGNARWGQNAVSAYPWGAHYLPLPTGEATAVRELLDEMGLVVGHDADGHPRYDERHLCHTPQERLYTDDGWQPGISLAAVARPEDAGDIAAFETQIEHFRAARGADGRKAFALPMAYSSTDPSFRALDGLSMRAFMDREGWWSERLRWYVDYCCRDDYGCTLDTTSAWAGWHYFCARDDEDDVLTWPEGNGRLVRHLADAQHPQIRTRQLVYRVHASAAREQGVEIDVLDAARETTVRYRAERLIFALPRFLAPHLITGYERTRSAGFTYSPWLVANLTVDRLPRDVAWDNVLYHSPSLGYVVATHQNLRMATDASVLTYYLPLTHADPNVARQELLATPWQDWTARILADLSLAHPGIETWVRRVDIMQWGHAMVRPTPGFLWSEARQRAADSYGAVTFAHSDMSGLSLFEEAQYRGVVAAEDWLRERGHPFTSSLAT